MFKNYFKIAFRNLLRNLSFTIINVIGLAIGMAITLLSLLYITNEFTFDHFHENKESIYRVILKSESNSEGTTTSSIATAGIGPSLLKEIPEVEAMVRYSSPRGGFFSYNNKNFQADYIMYADSTVFKMFSFDLLQGNSETVLRQPFTAVLTSRMAKKIFGDENKAVGKVINFNNKDDILITGIVDDSPVNSHLQFDVLISFTSLYKDPRMFLGWNGGHNYYTYILLKKEANIEQVESHFQ